MARPISMDLPSLALTACIRDEAATLPAFLAYHRALGVERAYLYLDRCTDATESLLRGHDWVEVIERSRDPYAVPLEAHQMACADDALARAWTEGIDWLLHLDPDEFAWGGPLAHAGASREAGDLRTMLARAAPRTEMVTLRPLEAVPVRRPMGTPFWTQHAMLDRGAIVRDVLDPWTGRTTRLGRWLGHVLGKSVARVAADLQSASAHRWTRRQGVTVPAELPVASEELGVHFHYVVRDGAHWLAKYRQLSTDPDVWLRGIAMEFPKLSWKKAAAVMSREDAERYFDEWVAVPDEIVARHRDAGVVIVAPHVERVLDEIGFTRTAAPARRHARRCRVAFVGVDACDPDLVDAWAADGTLPTFRRLLDRSLIADTEPPPGFFVGAIWPSFWTAVGPGQHGVHCWEQLAPGTYDVRRFLAGREVARRPFWRTLGDSGCRVALLDVPLAGLTPGLGGAQILEWGGHDPEEGFRTEPPTLAAEVLQAVGAHPVQGNCNAHRTTDEFVRFRDDLVTGVERRTRLHRWLLARDDWDLFVTVYGESHCVGHQCWHFHDPTHVRHDPAAAARVGNPVRDVYRAIDTSLGDLLETLDEQATVLVFPSHGMAAHYDPTFLLDDVLLRLDAIGALSCHRRGAASRAERTCFQVTNNMVDGAIRVNLVGREPNGLIRPGREYDVVCRRIADALGTLVDVDTGQHIVARVVRTRDVYRGEQLAALPDLWVEWRKVGHVHRVESPLIGRVERDWHGCRTGDHRPGGRVLVSGPHVRPGRLERPVRVIDLAPTLAAMLGVTLPDVDGTPVPELVRGRVRAAA